jgi:hypothetical protein
MSCMRRLRLGCTGLIVILGILVLGLRLFSGKTYLRVESPDKKYVAEWREYCSSAAATDSCLGTIELKTRYNPYRHSVLEALRLGRPSIIWRDSRTLVVDCKGCGTFPVKCDTCKSEPYTVAKESRWHDVTILYGKQGPSPKGQG